MSPRKYLAADALPRSCQGLMLDSLECQKALFADEDDSLAHQGSHAFPSIQQVVEAVVL